MTGLQAECSANIPIVVLALVTMVELSPWPQKRHPSRPDSHSRVAWRMAAYCVIERVQCDQFRYGPEQRHCPVRAR